MTHDTYGKSISTEITDTSVVNYFIHNSQLVVVTYDRRSTRTTEEVQCLPRSLA